MTKADGTDQTLGNNSIVHWGEDDPTDASGRHRGITCGHCREHRFARPYIERETWTGLCTNCSYASNRRSDDEPHASGSTIHRGEPDPEDPTHRSAITCHKCEVKKFDFIKAVTALSWSGKCADCRRQVKSPVTAPVKIEQKKGAPADEPAELRRCQCLKCLAVRGRAVGLNNQKHSSPRRGSVKFEVSDGSEKDDISETWVHYDWRDPEEPHYRFLMTCRRCGDDSFIPKPTIQNGSWQRFCSDCADKYGTRKGRRTLTGRHTNPFGSVIDYDVPDLKSGYALVECPNYKSEAQQTGGVSNCGGKEEKRVDAHNQDSQPFYCGVCGPKIRSAEMRAAKAAVRSMKLDGTGREKDEGADQVLPLDVFKRRTEEMTPCIVKAQKLAKGVLSYDDLYGVVHADFPNLVPEVVTMLPTYLPSECAREQVAHILYGYSYTTYTRRLREQTGVARRGAANR